MYEASMKATYVRDMGIEKAIEVMKADIIDQIRTAGKDEKEFFLTMYDEFDRFRLVAKQNGFESIEQPDPDKI